MIDSPAQVRGLTVGLLGGSFNPAHGGHVDISDATRRALKLDRVWWLVSPGNPLKDPKEYAPLAERIAQAETITKGRPWLRVTDIETRLGTRYTADTLRALTHRYADTKFVWIMGADSLANFHRWRDWREIADLVPLAVVSRPGENVMALKSPAARSLSKWSIPRREAHKLASANTPSWVFLPLVHNPQSATALRQSRKGL